MQYFEVEADDDHYADRWFLDDPMDTSGNSIDSREFRYGLSYVGAKPDHVPVDQPGRQIAFNLGAFNMPVTSREVAEIIGKHAKANIERFPVTVGPGKLKGWEIINVAKLIRCVDEKVSEFTRFGADAPQNRLIGKYEMFLKLRIDPQKVKNQHIFRVEDWAVSLIVSDEIRRALVSVKNLGIVFVPVTDE